MSVVHLAQDSHLLSLVGLIALQAAAVLTILVVERLKVPHCVVINDLVIVQDGAVVGALGCGSIVFLMAMDGARLT